MQRAHMSIAPTATLWTPKSPVAPRSRYVALRIGARNDVPSGVARRSRQECHIVGRNRPGGAQALAARTLLPLAELRWRTTARLRWDSFQEINHDRAN